jgi:hypothetical protein
MPGVTFPSACLGPVEGMYATFLLVVSDQDRSRHFYQSVFGGKILRERDPVILEIANTRLILNVGGGPTDDKPTDLRRLLTEAACRLNASQQGWGGPRDPFARACLMAAAARSRRHFQLDPESALRRRSGERPAE